MFLGTRWIAMVANSIQFLSSTLRAAVSGLFASLSRNELAPRSCLPQPPLISFCIISCNGSFFFF